MQSRSANYQYVLNIQTTGLEPENDHRIIEFACIKLRDGIDTGEYVHLYVNPEGKSSDPGALAQHSVTDDFLRDKPFLGHVVGELMQFLQSEGGSPTLIVHNAGFVKKFLGNGMVTVGMRTEWNSLASSTWVDTWVMARTLHAQHNKLDELAEEFNIASSDREAGMYKADILAKLYLPLKQRYDAIMAQQCTATTAKTGLFSASAKAAAKSVDKRQGRKNVMGHASGM